MFIECQVYAKLDTGSPELQGTHGVMGETHAMWGDAVRRPEMKPGHGGGIHRHSAFILLGWGTDDKLMTQGRERSRREQLAQMRSWKMAPERHC